MIGIVLVSHSRALADAAVALASAMVPAQARPEIAVAAGLADGSFGTDAAAISIAIQQVDSDDGVLVLLDLGSALLSTELAIGFLDADLSERVVISSAPLVEGLLTAVVAASAGASLAAVATEAAEALDAKRGQVDAGEPASPGPRLSRPAEEPAPATPAALTWRTPVHNRHGLHIRPAAALVTALRELDAHLAFSNASTGAGPVSALSISRLTGLEIGHGQILEARISGPDAEKAREILSDLAARDFGEAPKPTRWARVPWTTPSDERGTAATGSGQQIVIGPVHRRTAVPSLDGYHPRSPKDELVRFSAAVAEVVDYLDALGALRPATAAILNAQAAMVEDRELAHDVVVRITEGFSAVNAVHERLTAMARGFDALTDPYLRERAQDVRSVRRLLLLALMGRPLIDDEPAEPCVWLVDELDAATASRLDQRLCLGVVTLAGGDSGHGALTAEARGIPVLTGRADAGALREGQLVAFDPITRDLWVEPTEELQTELARRSQLRAEAESAALSRAHEPAFTRSGTRIVVAANVSSVADAYAAAAAGAEGSGVVRTEILFAARTTAPSAEEQAETYLILARALHGGLLSVRTWDAGGDKPLAFLPGPREPNPALGGRGIRTMRRAPEIFAEQLRGVVLAARETPIRVMFPMITHPDEVRWARSILDDVLRELGGAHVPVGMTVEVPAAALRAADFAGLVDFVSLGTNDLAQYALAIDRTNALVSSLVPADDTAVWLLVEAVCRGLPDIPVAVCGDLASNPALTERFIALGVSELSVRPPMVAQVKQAVRDTPTRQHWE